MAAIQYAYRIDVVGHAQDGAWDVLVWSLVDPDNGTTHESSCYWSWVPGNAKHVWQQLNAGRVPSELIASLSGWRGLHISGVQQWRRFARPDGWGPWELHVPVIDGTRVIRTGTLAGQDDPRPAAAEPTPAGV